MNRMADGRRPVITLDGPAASGKSSAAKAVAARLGIAYVSSGLLYRAVTRLALTSGIDPTEEPAVLALLERRQVRLYPDVERDRVSIDGVDVSAELHTDAIDDRVSDVAKLAGVRDWVTDRLQELTGPFVIDGRDMGTVVFPDARWKFYLTAPAEIRARRRVGERSNDIASVAQGLRRRDERDARQSVPAPDAVHLDTGPLSLQDVVDFVCEHVADSRSFSESVTRA